MANEEPNEQYEQNEPNEPTENKDYLARLTNLTSKQKIMAVVTLVVILIVLWQLFDLFHTDSPAPLPKPIVPISSAQHPAALPATTVATAQQTTLLPQAPPPPALPVLMPSTKEVDLLKQQQDDQKKYLTAVNELQMLKVQRDIAETNRAISAAKLATVTADKNMSDLLTRPSGPPDASGAYATSLLNPTQPAAAPPIPVAAEATYVVISVSMKFNRWSAILSSQGKLFNVTVGDVLPLDGSIVTNINDEGVVLRKDGIRKKVSILSSI